MDLAVEPDGQLRLMGRMSVGQMDEAELRCMHPTRSAGDPSPRPVPSSRYEDQHMDHRTDENDPADVESPYTAYLHVPQLLALQQPRTRPARGAQWCDEHLFIVVHQASELLLAHALVELRQLRHPTGSVAGSAQVTLQRVHDLLRQLEGLLTLLDTLSEEDFASFRPLLGEASGGQSVQFAELFHHITQPRCGAPLPLAHARQMNAGVTRVREAAKSWKERHLHLVERMIADQPGTDGTAGVAYLRSRIDRAT
ncbi:tryptophan 2,3-dioxygenase family protein [Streptomyces sp. NPDC051214]|uniref:tryptophan 2,3-dioxygenase family protein n=1 Tax=Streptomyces sp. NPDC051214 TaxID=3155282 RepID=UPI00342D7A15